MNDESIHSPHLGTPSKPEREARKPYRKPELAELGKVVDLTLGSAGSRADGRTTQP